MIKWKPSLVLRYLEGSKKNTKHLAKVSLALSLITLTFASGCVVEPHEGYWDRAHGRWYHDHAWVVCGPGETHCR